ncbi:glycerophosphodiester phosphodiesterase [Larkinella knui]|nr:glycerophosphodiester phosphodiesterase family protein [Larkinella knui]
MKNCIRSVIFGLLFVACSSKKDPVSTPVYTTKVIAHRGAWKAVGAPENSMASLRQAIRLGCYGSEFDVQMAADSVLFINHDTSLQGISIETTPSSKLLALKLSNGETLPTLQSFLAEGVQQAKTRLMIEIKGSRISQDRTFATARKAIELVKAMKAQALVEYSSFDYEVCKKMRQIDPTANVVYLNGDQTPEQVAADKLSGLDYYYGIFILKEDWIRQAQQKNLTVNVWTVNETLSMKWFLERKVDFITTDEPERLLDLLKQ